MDGPDQLDEQITALYRCQNLLALQEWRRYLPLHLPTPVREQLRLAHRQRYQELTPREPELVDAWYWHCSEGQHGQGLVEYVLIILFVVIAVVGILVVLGPTIGQIFSQITRTFQR